MTKKNSFISLRPEIVGSLMEDALVTAGDRIAPSFGQPIGKKMNRVSPFSKFIVKMPEKVIRT